MPALTFFYQECPICGRSLRVSVNHFGRQMCCTHCQGEFQAGKFQGGKFQGDKDELNQEMLPAAAPPLLGAATGAALASAHLGER
ncbi:MAG TPA: hypothetical protein VGJ16_12415 [Pirellulales bacterium]